MIARNERPPGESGIIQGYSYRYMRVCLHCPSATETSALPQKWVQSYLQVARTLLYLLGVSAWALLAVTSAVRA